MSNVTSISEYLAREPVEALEHLLNEAQQGQITGLVYACKYADRRHDIGLAGDYRKDPLPVLAITSRIEARVNQIIDSRNEAPLRPDS